MGARTNPRDARAEIACVTCGTFFLTKQYRVLDPSRGKFCSKPCYYVGRSLNRVPLAVRFWAKVNKTPTCWLWTGARIPRGYGHIGTGGRDGRDERVHRVAWEMASGAPVPEGFDVLHVCDVRLCVRNDEPGTYEVNGVLRPRFGHLFLGTPADNTADMMRKGRHYNGHIKHDS